MELSPRHYLRLEGAVVAAFAVAAYFALGGPLWMLALLALAPDVSMVGYAAGPRRGAFVYNAAHTYALPVALGAAGFLTGAPLVTSFVALVWAGHIGADRALGYGLKFESGFKDTHLSSQPSPASLLTEES